MKPYSVDLRERIVQTLKDNKTLTAPDVAELFKVGVATVYRYLQLDRDLLDHKMHLLDSKTHLAGGIADGHGRFIILTHSKALVEPD